MLYKISIDITNAHTVSSSMNLLEIGFGVGKLEVGPLEAEEACSELLASSSASASSKFFVVFSAAVAVCVSG